MMNRTCKLLREAKPRNSEGKPRISYSFPDDHTIRVQIDDEVRDIDLTRQGELSVCCKSELDAVCSKCLDEILAQARKELKTDADKAVIEAAVKWLKVRDGETGGRLTDTISSLILSIRAHPDYNARQTKKV